MEKIIYGTKNMKQTYLGILISLVICMAFLLSEVPVFGAPGDACRWGRIETCNGRCKSQSWIDRHRGDGDCDNKLDCAYFNYDDGDCWNCYEDNDGDTYGNNTKAPCGTGTVDNNDDCDDTNADIHPGAAEVCDSVDNDCDGSVDEGLPTNPYYRDRDGDGYGRWGRIWRCEAPAGYADNNDDCDDYDENVHPGATEVCDDKDNDCNGVVDDGADFNTYYRDRDHDGYGNPDQTRVTCATTPPSGYVTDGTDCDDRNANIHPGATEVCDGVDNDCANGIDDGLPTTTYYHDADDDEYGNPSDTTETCASTPPNHYVTDDTDCDDGNADVHPGATEICGNGVDDDCAGGDQACETGDECDCGWEWHHGLRVWECNGQYDCNGDCQSNWRINRDLNDDECDEYLNCEYFNHDGGHCEIIADCYIDSDGDTYGDPEGETDDYSFGSHCPDGFVDNNDDCQDAVEFVEGDVTYYGADFNPDAVEVCDGLDNDCDGSVDEGLAVSTYYQDGDGDTYGNPDVHMDACAVPANFVEDHTDCDDTNADIHPGAYDICENSVDEDCNGEDRDCGDIASVCADLSNVPLETQVEAAPPIVMLLMDDSGSMDWSLLCPEKGGKFIIGNSDYEDYDDVEEYWHSQYWGYNGVYYNPDLDYSPWPDTNTATYDDADMDDPKSHPKESGTRDLNSRFDSFDGVNVCWAHYYVWSSTEEAPYMINITGSGGSYSLDYYKVSDCNGDCSSAHVTIDDFESDDSPPDDVITGRTAAQERQNFANWYQYYRTRQLTAISAMANMVNSVQGMKIGLHTLNHNNDINMIAPRLVDTNRGVILDDLYNVGAAHGTPLRNALKAVGEYYASGEDSPYSDSNNGGQCQQAYCIMMTDGYYNGSDPSSVGNQDADTAGNPYDGGEFADTYSDTLADVAMKYYKNDLKTNLVNVVPTSADDLATHQHMVTYSISFGMEGVYDPDDYSNCPLGVDSCPDWPDVDEDSEDKRSITDLWHAAVNGRGKFMKANNAQQLAYALIALMQDVSKREGSGASVAVNSHELKQGTKMYQGTYNSAGWSGDLKAYPLNSDGSVAQTPVWAAAHVLDARVTSSGHGDRHIYTFGRVGLEFTSANIDSLTTEQQNFLGADATARINLVNFIRGDFSNDKNHNGGLRARVTRLGDIVHSEPKYIKGYLYVGANDGMLHVFNASNGQEVFAYVPGFVYPNLEELANPDYTHRYFVDLSPFLGYDANDDVLLIGGLGKGGKGYFCLNIDINNPGSFTAADVKWEYPNADSSSDEKDNMGFSFSEPVIIETENAGLKLIFGNGYDSANARAVLYVLDPTDPSDTPKMIDTGYGSPNPASNNCNGLSTPVFIDSNINGKADFAYAGDLRGNVWKFDISSANVDDWAVAYQDGNGDPQPLFQARDDSGNPQPITTRLTVKAHCVRGYSGYMVVFGTGKFNASGDFTDSSTQAIYGIWDWAAEWVEEGGTGPDKYFGSFNNPNTGNLSNLSENTVLSGVGEVLTLLSQSSPETTVTYLGNEWGVTSSNEINWFNVRAFIADPDGYADDPNAGFDVGWYYSLDGNGERVIADPVLWLGYALFVSQVPAENMCQVGGTAYLTALNFCTGAAPDEPLFDADNDNDIDENDTLDDEKIPNRLTLEDFITYSPTMIEDRIYFGPAEDYMVESYLSGVLFWRFLNFN